jgi:hypothetical protein
VAVGRRKRGEVRGRVEATGAEYLIMHLGQREKRTWATTRTRRLQQRQCGRPRRCWAQEKVGTEVAARFAKSSWMSGLFFS